MVSTFTGGRTTSLREMEPGEYNFMCDSMLAQQVIPSEEDFTAKIKRLRSAVLKRLQKLGVDTTDWAKVDNFCLKPQISGKLFRHLTIEELTALIPKLESISKKSLQRVPKENNTPLISSEAIEELVRFMPAHLLN